MLLDSELEALIRRGGVFEDVEGSSIEEIYRNCCRLAHLPDYVPADALCAELLEREKILSTAVGSGVAIPHPRKAMMRTKEDQRIAVCFLKRPIDMNAPDGRSVSTLFILLTVSPHPHLEILSTIANLLREKSIRDALEAGMTEQALLDLLKGKR